MASLERKDPSECVYEKLAITLPRHVAEVTREETRAIGSRSLSAFIAKPIEEKLERDHVEQVLEMDAEHGPVSPEKLPWAGSVLDRVLERGS